MHKVWKDIVNGLDLGGRAVDLSQLGMSLREAVYAEFGNNIPFEVNAMLNMTVNSLNEAEKNLKDFAEMVICKKDGKLNYE